MRKPIGRTSWVYRNPRTFILTGVTVSLAIIFSKPIYDIYNNIREKPNIPPPTSNAS